MPHTRWLLPQLDTPLPLFTFALPVGWPLVGWVVDLIVYLVDWFSWLPLLVGCQLIYSWLPCYLALCSWLLFPVTTFAPHLYAHARWLPRLPQLPLVVARLVASCAGPCYLAVGWWLPCWFVCGCGCPLVGCYALCRLRLRLPGCGCPLWLPATDPAFTVTRLPRLFASTPCAGLPLPVLVCWTHALDCVALPLDCSWYSWPALRYCPCVIDLLVDCGWLRFDLLLHVAVTLRLVVTVDCDCSCGYVVAIALPHCWYPVIDWLHWWCSAVTVVVYCCCSCSLVWFTLPVRVTLQLYGWLLPGYLGPCCSCDLLTRCPALRLICLAFLLLLDCCCWLYVALHIRLPLAPDCLALCPDYGLIWLPGWLRLIWLPRVAPFDCCTLQLRLLVHLIALWTFVGLLVDCPLIGYWFIIVIAIEKLLLLIIVGIVIIVLLVLTQLLIQCCRLICGLPRLPLHTVTLRLPYGCWVGLPLPGCPVTFALVVAPLVYVVALLLPSCLCCLDLPVVCGCLPLPFGIWIGCCCLAQVGLICRLVAAPCPGWLPCDFTIWLIALVYLVGWLQLPLALLVAVIAVWFDCTDYLPWTGYPIWLAGWLRLLIVDCHVVTVDCGSLVTPVGGGAVPRC